MTGVLRESEPRFWARAYRPLRPRSLALQLALVVAAEVALFATYSVHDARFHWATHFLVGLATAGVVLLVRLLITGVPGPRFILTVILGLHLFAMTPDLVFRAGAPHAAWMDLFLGHIAAHEIVGGDATWLAIALVSVGGYGVALTLWLRARTTEAVAGMPPGIGLTGGAVLRAQADPRRVELVSERFGSNAATGRSVVLLHGLGASAAFWRPVARALALADKGMSVLAPNLLGFGDSLRIGTHFHLADQSAAVIRLIEQRGGHPVELVGHSAGAAVAAQVAQDRPDLVEGLVLVAPAVFSDPDEARRRIGGRSWMARKTMDESPVADIACGIMCLLRRPLTSLAPRLARRRHPRIPDDVARGAVTYVWPAYRDALAGILHENPLNDLLATSASPITVIAADDDTTVISDDLFRLVAGNVRFVRMPGTHFIPLEYPTEVAEVIGSRLTRE